MILSYYHFRIDAPSNKTIDMFIKVLKQRGLYHDNMKYIMSSICVLFDYNNFVVGNHKIRLTKYFEQKYDDISIHDDYMIVHNDFDIKEIKTNHERISNKFKNINGVIICAGNDHQKHYDNYMRKFRKNLLLVFKLIFFI